MPIFYSTQIEQYSLSVTHIRVKNRRKLYLITRGDGLKIMSKPLVIKIRAQGMLSLSWIIHYLMHKSRSVGLNYVANHIRCNMMFNSNIMTNWYSCMQHSLVKVIFFFVVIFLSKVIVIFWLEPKENLIHTGSILVIDHI